MATPRRAMSLNLPPSYSARNEPSFYTPPSEELPVRPQVVRSLSPDEVQKMKYKIELDKQVNEKQLRIAREWEKKIERDKKYVQHQPFGRRERTTVLNQNELEEILTKGRAPSPILEMPQQYSLHQQQQQQQQQQQAFTTETYIPNDSSTSNTYGSPRQSTYNPQYSTYIPPQPQTQSQQPNNYTDFQRFYGPNGNSNSNGAIIQGSSSTAQPIRGDAHDPFLLYDPNKEGQNVFNVIPQQDLYDPWGRPGAGAPLIHAPTGQRFTRYSGSLQDKLNHAGSLGFYRRQYTGNIEEQKRDLELEQRRRQQEEMEHRSNAGDTAEWITQLERSRYPLKLHLPTTEATREVTGIRTRYRTDQSRILHDDLVRQAEERARLQKLNRYEDSLAELHHSEAMNNWWGRSGGGAPSITNRRHNVHNTFEDSRRKWTTNHLGQLILADSEAPSHVAVQTTDYFQPRHRQLSNHRNFYEIKEDQTS